MKPLTNEQKENFSEEAKRLVNLINTRIIDMNLGLELKQLAYNIPIDNKNYYFDFPYNPILDKINEALNHDPYDQIVFNAFRKYYLNLVDTNLRMNSDRSYVAHIDYTFRYNDLNREIEFLNIGNNIGLSETDVQLVKFLSMLNDCEDPSKVKISKEYLLPKVVEKVRDNCEIERHICLCRHSSPNTPLDSRTLNATLKFVNDKRGTLDLNESIINELYHTVFYTLEMYFESPVLTKVFESKFRKELLAINHAISNLDMKNTIDLLTHYVQHGTNGVEIKLEVLKRKYKLLESILLYQLSHIDEPPGGTYFARNKNIVQICEYFNNEINYFYDKTHEKFINMQVVVHDEIMFNYIPNQELIVDLSTTLWNLIHNACKEALNHENPVVCVLLELWDFQPSVSIINIGIMPEQFIQYINRSDVPYPQAQQSSKPYRGLEIVKDRIVANDQRIRVKIVKDQVHGNCTNVCFTI